MNPIKIAKQIVKKLLVEQLTEKVSLYPGAFKPPHRGHVATILRSIDDKTDKVIVFISTKEREDVDVKDRSVNVVIESGLFENEKIMTEGSLIEFEGPCMDLRT